MCGEKYLDHSKAYFSYSRIDRKMLFDALDAISFSAEVIVAP
jgi:hypothetical protein